MSAENSAVRFEISGVTLQDELTSNSATEFMPDSSVVELPPPQDNVTPAIMQPDNHATEPTPPVSPVLEIAQQASNVPTILENNDASDSTSSPVMKTSPLLTVPSAMSQNDHATDATPKLPVVEMYSSYTAPIEKAKDVINISSEGYVCSNQFQTAGSEQSIITEYNAGKLILRHHIFEDGQWKMKLAQPHPTVLITVTTNTDDYKLFRIKCPNDISK